jgi:tRNA A37 methylthiotransferase MiaB
LGCPKNLVDSEVMMGLLDRAGARLTARPEEAEILVVNTCSFIDTAKQESVDTILEMARHKTEGRATKLIVAGCLVERYRDEIRKSIPEVDAVVGTGELESILEASGIARPAAAAPSPFNILSGSAVSDTRAGREALAGTHKGEAAGSRAEGELREQQGRFSRDDWQGAAHMLPTYLYDESTPRLISTGRTSAYIKIAEGCDHPCTFCVIPNLRGKFHASRSAGAHRRTALAAFPVRLPQPHHWPPPGDDSEARQHLQIPRCTVAARITGCFEAHEARRRCGHFSQDAGQGACCGAGDRAAHVIHCRVPRRNSGRRHGA